MSASPDHWEDIARENVDRWGEQPPAVLLLALVEEVAETVDELLKTAEKGTETMVPAEAMARLAAVRDAGFECRAFLEREFEDETGDPLPREEWPTLVWDFDAVAVAEELDDTAPLVYQLAWALDEWESKRSVATDGGKHVCEACGEDFRTLTKLRLHEKDDCPDRETFAQLDPDAADTPGQAAEGLLTCRDCGRENPGASYDETASLADGDYHLIVEFQCAGCGFENENRVVLTGVDEGDLENLPPHLQPDDGPVATDGGWDPQPARLREDEAPDAYSHATRNAALIRDANRQLSGLGEKIHYCCICGQECADLEELADHDCRPNAGVELSAREIVERTGGA